MSEEKNYEYAEPNASSLIQSLRAFGYDISTAVSDLIDNSITAGASKVEIKFDWNNGEPWIFVADNGCGMTERVLHEAMKPGSKSPLEVRDENDLGRFGLGLKTASFSQCRRLTVITKASGSDVVTRCWDLDIVTAKNQWILLKTGTATANEIGDQYFKNNRNGTVVLWEKIDRIIPENHINDVRYQKAFLEFGQILKKHISLVFSGFMKGKNKILFTLNDNPIQLWDPFMTDNKYTIEMPAETLYIDGDVEKPVDVKGFVLPHQSRLTEEEYIRGGGPNGWVSQQGFYVYRNNRLLVAGQWLISGMQKRDSYKLARIRVDIGNNVDKEWKIDVKKSIAVPPISVADDLKRIAEAVRKSSSQLFSHRGKRLIRASSKDKSYVWHQIKRKNKIGYSINREHPFIKELLRAENGRQIKQLLHILEETIPVPAIITDYSEHEEEMLAPFEGLNVDYFDEMLENLYNSYIRGGMSAEDAMDILTSTEPFIQFPDKLQIFREKKGL